MAKQQKPSDLEMQILSVLWENGPLTARQVMEAMPDGKQRAYTSVLSVMQVMEKKGLLTHTNQGTAHVYKPAQSKKRVLKPFMQKIVSEVFAGRPADMMQALLSGTRVGQAEIEEMQQLLVRAKAQTKSGD